MSAGADRAPLWQEEAVAALVHELRTPVTTIRALAEMMMQAPDMDGAERQGFLSIIAAESQRMINETYSAFVQGFMPTLARPDVDLLEGLDRKSVV